MTHVAGHRDRLTRPQRPANGLPALDESSRAQRWLWALWIGMALCLVILMSIRLWQQAESAWWMPLAALSGLAAADFASGVVHWGADTWGRSDLPVIGPRVLVPFRVHHVNPDDFLTRPFLDTNGDAAGLTIPVLIGLLFLPVDTVLTQTIGVFGLVFCAAVAMTNQIHQWAHGASPATLIRAAQGIGLLLRPCDHAAHHDRPYDANYCITTGWWNRPLQAIGFFRRLETVITRVTGAEPRDDEWIFGRRAAGEQDAWRAHR